MDATLFLVDLAGSVALLLWGVHMVQSGIQRAFGPALRGVLAAALSRRWRAVLAGIGVTAVLQSSTATGLMVTGFTVAGLVDLVPALAVMLGANIGTTLIVQVLSFDVSWLSMLLVLVGVVMFRRAGATRVRDLGRVAIGLGLMLLALHQLLALVTPYEDVPSLRLLLGVFVTSPVMGLLLAAVITWAAHSSVAVVLLIMSLAARGVVPLDAAFAMVLGANLGTAVNPLLEGGAGEDPATRRLPLGNLLTRIAGCIAVLPAIDWLGRQMVQIEPDAARAVADFHTGFNLALALVFFPLLPPYARLLRRLLPARVADADPGQPLYLDGKARESPSVAIAAAAREALRMSDMLEAMLSSAGEALIGGDRKRVAETRRLDDVVERLNAAVRSYLTSLDADALSDDDHRRLGQILAFTTHLAHAGDVVNKNLMTLASRRLKHGLTFSDEGRVEIGRLLARLAANLRTAAAVFLTEDARAARLLASEKAVFRDQEAQATAAHFQRLREGRIESAESGALHLDVLRDLERINAHLVAAAAYPVLEGQGALLPDRLRPSG